MRGRTLVNRFKRPDQVTSGYDPSRLSGPSRRAAPYGV